MKYASGAINWLKRSKKAAHKHAIPRGRKGTERLSVGRQLTDMARVKSVKKQRDQRLKDTQRAKRNRRAQRRQSAIVLVVSTVVMLAALSRFFILDVTISGEVGEDQKKLYHSSADSYFEGIVSRFKGNFDEAMFMEYFSSTAPSVSSSTVNTSALSTTLEITITERSKTVGWIDQRRDAYFLIDALGIAYEQIEVLPSNIPVVTDISGIQVQEGAAVTSVETLYFIQSLFDESAGEGLPISGFIIGDTTRDIEATLQGYEFRVKFTSNRTAEDQIKDLQPTVELLAGEGRLPIEYVDVRVADKVFYK